MEESSGFFGLMEKYLMGPLTTLSTKQFVRAIMAAGMASIPFVIVGSALLILNCLPQAMPFLQGIWDATFNKITSLYMMGYYFSMNVVGIYFCLAMGFELTKIKAEAFNCNMDPLNGAFLGFFAYMLTLTELVWQDGQFVQKTGDNMIGGISYGAFVTRFGSAGIFVGILMACLAVWIYKECVVRGIVIKLPDAVPAGVSKSFTALIPAAFVWFAVTIIDAIAVLLGTDLFTAVGLPFSFVQNLVNTWYGVFIIEFLVMALWSVGIHGANIIGAFTQAPMLANIAHNAEVYERGGDDWYVVTDGFTACYQRIGGSGGTLCLVIMMMFMAKSEQLRVLGRAAIGPGIFEINEPVIFGVPMMYNPDLMVPFIFAPAIAGVVAYFLIASGIFPYNHAAIPWVSPVGISGFLGTTSFMGGILSVGCFLLEAVIYFPFFKRYDAKLYKQEQEAEQA
jgi:PTS system cellobiose-specific IIC component